MASKKKKQDKNLLTTAQVAVAVGVNEETVRRWIRGGALPATYNLMKPGGIRRVYRVEKKHVDIILAGQWPANNEELSA